MRTLAELFKNIILVEEDSKSEAIGHLPHVVEASIHGNHESSIAHLENAFDIIRGKKGIKGSNLSQKADGKVSILFGKKNGVPFVKYKGGGAKPLTSVESIKQHTVETGKDYLEDSFMMGLKAAGHPSIGGDTSYQADTMVDHAHDAVRGNIVKYKKPAPTTKSILAVHTKLENGVNTQSGAPDLSHVSNEEMHFPNLSMKGKSYAPTQEESSGIKENIGKAKKIFSDRGVVKVVKDIASHRGETQTSHRSVFFREFNNKFQNGEASERTVPELMKFAGKKLEKTTNKKEKERILDHIKYISANTKHISKILQAHSHIDTARDHIINVLNRANPELKPMDPETGEVNYNYSEGFVSDIPGHGQVKFVPKEFSVRNRSESAARKVVKEDAGMMTASSGAISGMGYNLGGPAPDDVAVAPLSTRKSKSLRRKLTRKFLDSVNLGNQA